MCAHTVLVEQAQWIGCFRELGAAAAATSCCGSGNPPGPPCPRAHSVRGHCLEPFLLCQHCVGGALCVIPLFYARANVAVFGTRLLMPGQRKSSGQEGWGGVE